MWPSVKNDNPDLTDGRMFHEAKEVIKGTKYAANHWSESYIFLLVHSASIKLPRLMLLSVVKSSLQFINTTLEMRICGDVMAASPNIIIYLHIIQYNTRASSHIFFTSSGDLA